MTEDTHNNDTLDRELSTIYEEGIREIHQIVDTYTTRMREYVEEYRKQRIEELQKELQAKHQ